MDKSEMSQHQRKGIASLQAILKIDSGNEFVKRKIAQLSSQNIVKQKITDDEAYYLALRDKYEVIND